MLDQIRDDVRFAFAPAQRQELPTMAAKLRYIVALNDEMTMEQWLAIALENGWHLGSARNRFNESRNISKEMDEWLK